MFVNVSGFQESVLWSLHVKPTSSQTLWMGQHPNNCIVTVKAPCHLPLKRWFGKAVIIYLSRVLFLVRFSWFCFCFATANCIIIQVIHSKIIQLYLFTHHHSFKYYLVMYKGTFFYLTFSIISDSLNILKCNWFEKAIESNISNVIFMCIFKKF